jgi:hypothetical protein
MSRPLKRMVPVVLTMPVMARSVVVFPAPLAPSRETMAPSSTAAVTPCRAFIGP